MSEERERLFNELLAKYKVLRNAQVAYFNQVKANKNPGAYKDISGLLTAAKKAENDCDAQAKKIIEFDAAALQSALKV